MVTVSVGVVSVETARDCGVMVESVIEMSVSLFVVVFVFLLVCVWMMTMV